MYNLNQYWFLFCHHSRITFQSYQFIKEAISLCRHNILLLLYHVILVCWVTRPHRNIVLCSQLHSRGAWTNGLLSSRPIVFNPFKYFCQGVDIILFLIHDGSASLVSFLIKLQCVTATSIPYNWCRVVVSLMFH